MSWLRRLVARRRIEQDLADEIRAHLEERVDELVAAGLPRDEALAAARRAFGNVTLVEERGREVWRWPVLEDLWADLRYATRQLSHTPAFATAAILTLALGIGANAAVFSVVNALLLKPLPFPNPDRLVSVESIDRRGGPHPESLSYPTFFDFRRANVFAHLASYRGDRFTLIGGNRSTVVEGAIVSSDFFDVLGVRPALGRGFLRADERRGTRVVVLAHALWTARFGADPAIVGRPVTIDSEPYVVIGVAPAGFAFPIDVRIQLWTTLARDDTADTVQPMTEQRGARMLNALGRLRPGDSIEKAHARLDAVALALARAYPDSNQNIPTTLVRPELARLMGDTRLPVLLLWAAVTLVLCIACANLANLLLARTADRERELGVRLAIGGSVGRVARQIATENLLLALAGSVCGVLLAGAVLSALVPFAADRLPRADGIVLDGGVLAFTVALALLTAALVTIPPVLRIRRIDFGGALRATARGTTDVHDRLRGTLVVVQIALGLVLTSGAGLLASGLVHLTHRDLGFRADRLMTLSLSLPAARYSTDAQLAFADRLFERLGSLPAVTGLAASMPLPLAGNDMVVSFTVPERPTAPGNRPHADMAIITPGFFRTLGTPVVAGREFTDQDDEQHPRVIVVNQAFADRFFPGERVIGRRIEPGARSDRDQANGIRLREIVGIVANVRQAPLGREPEPIYYFPYKQLPWMLPSLVVQTTRSPSQIEADVRRMVAALDPEIAVHDVRSFHEMLEMGVAGTRLATWLMAGFAVIALLLTGTGVHGLLAYAVLRRTREIGVRVALGASRANVLAMVGRRALVLVAAGVLFGTSGTLALGRATRSLVPVPLETGPALLIGAALVIALTAAVAAFAPASRAASVDPTQALRSE